MMHRMVECCRDVALLILYINSFSLSVSQSWAQAGIGHGLGKHWAQARAGTGHELGKHWAQAWAG